MNPAPNDRDSPVHSFLSPEAVRLDLPISGPVPRMLAYGIDLFTMIVLVIFLYLIVTMTLPIGAAIDNWIGAAMRDALQHVRTSVKHPGSATHFQGLAIAIFLITEFTISTGYFIFWEMVTGGRSPGKLLVGLRVVRRNGLPIDLRSSVIRNLMRAVDMLPAQYLFGLTSILLSSSGERLGDHVAGTIVLRLDRPETSAEIPRPEHSGALILTRAQLAKIGPREMQLIRGVLRRSSTLEESRRQALLAEAAEAMRVRLDLVEFAESDNVTFLNNLLVSAERFAGSD